LIRQKAAKLAFTAVIAATPMVAATSAHASGTECNNYLIGSDNTSTSLCIYVNGSGLRINWAEDQISNADTSNQPGDIWFPTTINCTVQPGWMDWNNAGNSNQNGWGPTYSCSDFKNSGGYTFEIDENVDAGALCGYMYFPIYGQMAGGTNDCVGIHS
jgi:hypothetical protein